MNIYIFIEGIQVIFLAPNLGVLELCVGLFRDELSGS